MFHAYSANDGHGLIARRSMALHGDAPALLIYRRSIPTGVASSFILGKRMKRIVLHYISRVNTAGKGNRMTPA